MSDWRNHLTADERTEIAYLDKIIETARERSLSHTAERELIRRRATARMRRERANG